MVIKSILSLEERTAIKKDFDSGSENTTKSEYIEYGIKNIYNLESTLPYLESLKYIFEEKIGIELIPVNTYMRKYTKGTRLTPHMDRKELDVTVSIQIDKSDTIVNPLIVHTNPKTILNLENGDAGIILYGNRILHERPVLKSDWMYNLFLHYSFKSARHEKKLI
jgi:hypothetical protein